MDRSITKSFAVASTLFALPHGLDAAIVYVDIPDFVVSPPVGARSTVPFKLQTFRPPDFQVGVFDRFVYVPNRAFVAIQMANNQLSALTQGGFFHKFAQGNAISGAVGGGWVEGGAPYKILRGRTTGVVKGPWVTGQTGFAGMRLEYPDGFHYGWIRMRVDNLHGADADPDTLTIFDYAFQDAPNTVIAAGAMPEPTSTALLALAAVGGAALRRKRKQGMSAER